MQCIANGIYLFRCHVHVFLVLLLFFVIVAVVHVIHEAFLVEAFVIAIVPKVGFFLNSTDASMLAGSSTLGSSRREMMEINTSSTVWAGVHVSESGSSEVGSPP